MATLQYIFLLIVYKSKKIHASHLKKSGYNGAKNRYPVVKYMYLQEDIANYVQVSEAYMTYFYMIKTQLIQWQHKYQIRNHR